MNFIPSLGLDLLYNLPLLSSLLFSLDILLDRLLHPFFPVLWIVSLCQLIVLTFDFAHHYRFFAHFLAVFIEGRFEGAELLVTFVFNFVAANVFAIL